MSSEAARLMRQIAASSRSAGAVSEETASLNTLSEPTGNRPSRRSSNIGVAPSAYDYTIMMHRYDMLDEQLSRGLGCVKDLATYLKKSCQAQVDCNNELIRHHKKAVIKADAFKADPLIAFVECSAMLEAVMEEQAQRNLRFATGVQGSVVEPLLSMNQRIEKQRRVLRVAYKKTTEQLQSALSDIAKQRKESLQSYEDMGAAKLVHDREGDPEKKAKLFNKLNKAQNTAYKHFDKFEKSRPQLLATVKMHYTFELPRILRELQQLEIDRMTVLRTHLATFTGLMSEFRSPLQLFPGMQSAAHALSPLHKLAQSVSSWRGQFGPAPKPDMALCDLPCNATALLDGSWCNNPARSPGPPQDWARGYVEKRSESVGSTAGERGAGMTGAASGGTGGGDTSTATQTVHQRAASSAAAPPRAETGEYYRALFDFQADAAEDISFAVGAVLCVTEGPTAGVVAGPEGPAEWWTAYVHNAEPRVHGRVPSNYIELIPPHMLPADIVAAAAAPEVSHSSGGSEWDFNNVQGRAASGSLLITNYNTAEAEGPSAQQTCTARYDFSYEPTGNEIMDTSTYLSFSVGDVIILLYEESVEWWYGELNGAEGYFPANLVEKLPVRQPSSSGGGGGGGLVDVREEDEFDDEEDEDGEPDPARKGNVNQRSIFVSQIGTPSRLGSGGEAEEKSGNALTNAIRGLVSKKKMRFQQDGFDLDLTYVTENIIAMGFPSEGSESVYRNPMKDVQKFFEARHADRYKIYNLCSERSYNAVNFHGRVRRFPFDDHNPSPFEMILPFCQDAEQWLASHPDNVVAIHCKAGKGRTGFFIASYLVYCGFSKDAQEALSYYGKVRTQNEKGVTIPSQIRFVHYFDEFMKNPQAIPMSHKLLLASVTIVTIPKAIAKLSTDVWFLITTRDTRWTSKGVIPPARFAKDSKSGTAEDIVLFGTRSVHTIPPLDQDMKIEVFHSTTFGKEKMFQCWLNTRFLKPSGSVRHDGRMEFKLRLSKDQMDKACKDKKHKETSSKLAVEFLFVSVDPVRVGTDGSVEASKAVPVAVAPHPSVDIYNYNAPAPVPAAAAPVPPVRAPVPPAAAPPAAVAPGSPVAPAPIPVAPAPAAPIPVPAVLPVAPVPPAVGGGPPLPPVEEAASSLPAFPAGGAAPPPPPGPGASSSAGPGPVPPPAPPAGPRPHGSMMGAKLKTPPPKPTMAPPAHLLAKVKKPA